MLVVMIILIAIEVRVREFVKFSLTGYCFTGYGCTLGHLLVVPEFCG